jgi:hypothetical protein
MEKQPLFTLLSELEQELLRRIYGRQHETLPEPLT